GQSDRPGRCHSSRTRTPAAGSHGTGRTRMARLCRADDSGADKLAPASPGSSRMRRVWLARLNLRAADNISRFASGELPSPHRGEGFVQTRRRCTGIGTRLVSRGGGGAGVGNFVLAQQSQVVERDREHFVAVVVALEDFGGPPFVFLEG